MLLQRTDVAEQPSHQHRRQSSTEIESDKPLACMFFFFVSQMKGNIRAPDPDLVRRGKMDDMPTHQFNNLLSRVGMHASYSPLVSKWETIPVEIPSSPHHPSQKSLPSRHEFHDTMLLMKFPNKRAREQWILTKEWQDFMKRTESEVVFRRMPHVRCASSWKGLMDPVDILTS